MCETLSNSTSGRGESLWWSEGGCPHPHWSLYLTYGRSWITVTKTGVLMKLLIYKLTKTILLAWSLPIDRHKAAVGEWLLMLHILAQRNT